LEQVCGILLLCILAVFFPPLPVLIKRGLRSCDFLISLLLTLCYLPGLFHAWYIIRKYEEDPFHDLESGRSRKASEVFSVDKPAKAHIPSWGGEEDMVDLGLEEERVRKQSYSAVVGRRVSSADNAPRPPSAAAKR